jgi:thioredoxin-dependent peroxiredoxin
MEKIKSRYLMKNSFLTMVMCMSIFSLKALSVGEIAPDFSLPDQDNKIRTLSEFRGKYVVLYFYPKDNTPGCTKQACSLRDNYSEFEKQDIVVLGINYDSPESHKHFKNTNHLPFTLLSDSSKSIAKKYGAKNWWFLPIPYRMTFIIDPHGNIRSILEKVDVSTHTIKILELILQLKQK